MPICKRLQLFLLRYVPIQKVFDDGLGQFFFQASLSVQTIDGLYEIFCVRHGVADLFDELAIVLLMALHNRFPVSIGKISLKNICGDYSLLYSVLPNLLVRLPKKLAGSG
jgi:hypothetical protein